MIYSMTGYAQAIKELPGGALSVELRAVNNRYLDLTLRLPEDLRSLEGVLRERLAGKLSRGKLECRVSYQTRDAGSSKLQLDGAFLAQLLALANEARAIAPDAGELKMGELLRWPGVLVSDALPASALQAECLQLLHKAIEDFAATRAREGEKLAATLIERIEKIEAEVTAVQPKLPAIIAAYEDKLATRLREALGSHDDDRIKQEMALFAQKIDVAEELSRLSAHLSEVRRVLKQGGTVGKRLDFLMQELHREANTLGSKSASIDTTRTSVELKVLIEQMREQVQNIE